MGAWCTWIGTGLVASGLLGSATARACDLPLSETARAASVIDGETLALDNGRQVRLLGFKAPVPPPDWKGPDPWPFAAQAKAALERISADATLELHFDARAEDRHGRLLAQLFLVRNGKRLWLQEELVLGGFGRVFVLPDLHACTEPLHAAERKARAARRGGLWRSLTYRVRDADDPNGLGYLRHTYQLVEGTVHAIGEGRRLVYINFAQDWRHDFTITIARKRVPVLEAGGLDLQALPGNRVRVRGWVEWWNGPMIAVSNLEEIDVLAPTPAGGLLRLRPSVTLQTKRPGEGGPAFRSNTVLRSPLAA